ncbi:MAG: hypothetical protein K2Y22_01800 [Candidatus Obscuribacterales bacterium]|nr:hypothetical protein [Candidatus Obscuribacterales bacterium]
MSLTRIQKLTVLSILSLAAIQPGLAAKVTKAQPQAQASQAELLYIAQATPAVPGKKEEPLAETSANQIPPVLVSNLAKAIDDYKASPSDTTWVPVVTFLQSLLNDSQATQADLTKLQTLIPQLTQLGLKVYDGGQARIWSFPQITQSREIIVEWREVKAVKVAGAKVASKAVIAHTQLITIPDVFINEAKVVSVPTGAVAVKPAVAKGAKAPAKTAAPVAKVPGTKFLVLTGNDKTAKTVWWSSYKFTSTGWVPASDLMASIPASLNSIQGKVSLSGSDLVVTVTPSVGTTTSYGKPDASAYKLVFHLNGGKYVMEGSAVDDSIHSVIFQFLRAEREGRLEMAKAWVTDPKLASIPKYIGLQSRTDGQLRLVAMPNPLNGCQRFRLVTYGRDDLIFDVGRRNDPRTKQIQWVIKAIFVAPADPALQKFARNLPTLDRSTFARLNADIEETTATAQSLQPDQLEEPADKKSVAATRSTIK